MMKSVCPSRSRGLNMFRLFQLLALVVFASAPLVEGGFAIPDKSQTHKIQITDRALATRISAEGGRLIADYGGYQLFEVQQLSPGLIENTRVELRDHYDLIRLNSGHLNTRKPEVQALRQPLGQFSGKHLHLVQFAGPVRADWREELLAAGAQIVSYIPENTYLIYGSAEVLANVQKLSAAPHYQWEGIYRDEYKIHPKARDVDDKGRPRDIGTDLFEIQLVDDPEANRRHVESAQPTQTRTVRTRDSQSALSQFDRASRSKIPHTNRRAT